MGTYIKTTWENGVAPAINETNLNNMEDGIFNNDSEVQDNSSSTPTTDTASIIPIGSDVVDGGMSVADVFGLSLVQSVVNGDFVDGAGNIADDWVSSNSPVLTWVSGEQTIENAIGTNNRRIEQNIQINSGDKYAFFFLAKIVSGTGILCKFFIGDNSLSFDDNDLTTEYNYVGGVSFATASSGGVIQFGVSGAIGKLAVKEVFAINMTANGIESFTEAQMLDQVRQGYWDGVKHTTAQKGLSVGVNLFDINSLTLGQADGTNRLQGGTVTEKEISSRTESNGEIALQGNFTTFIYPFVIFKFKIKAGDFRVQSLATVTENNSSYISFLDKNFTVLSRNFIGTVDAGVIDVASEIAQNTEYVSIEYSTSTGSTTNKIIYLNSDVLAKFGAEAIDFVEYTPSTIQVTPPTADGNYKRVPNGVADKQNMLTGEVDQNVSDDTTIDGTESWGTLLTSTVTYRMQVTGWVTGKNIVTNTLNSGLAVNVDGIFPVETSSGSKDYPLIFFNSIDSTMYLRIEKSLVDAQAGATTELKFIAYLNLYPITLDYQLLVPIPFNVPPQSLVAYKSGTVYFTSESSFTEKATAGVITIPNASNEDYFINEVLSLKIIQSDGSTVDVAVDTFDDTTITADATDPNHDAAGVYEVEYSHVVGASTIPSFEYSYATNHKQANDNTTDIVDNLSQENVSLNNQVSNINNRLVVGGAFKSASSTYTDNDTGQTFIDTFCTAESLVTIVITDATAPQGIWSVVSGDGDFTITSTEAETDDIDFDYYIQKAGV